MLQCRHLIRKETHSKKLDVIHKYLRPIVFKCKKTEHVWQVIYVISKVESVCNL